MTNKKKPDKCPDFKEGCVETCAHPHEYNNPDPTCRHPFSPACDDLMYCWTYAHHVDGTPGYEDLAKHCKGCEYKVLV